MSKKKQIVHIMVNVRDVKSKMAKKTLKGVKKQAKKTLKGVKCFVTNDRVMLTVLPRGE